MARALRSRVWRAVSGPACLVGVVGRAGPEEEAAEHDERHALCDVSHLAQPFDELARRAGQRSRLEPLVERRCEPAWSSCSPGVRRSPLLCRVNDAGLYAGPRRASAKAVAFSQRAAYIVLSVAPHRLGSMPSDFERMDITGSDPPVSGLWKRPLGWVSVG